MGVYADWVYLRFQRKTALKTFVRTVFQRVLRRLPRAFRMPEVVQPAAAQIGGQLWEEKACFMKPLVSGRFGTRDAKDLKRAPRVVHLIGSLQPGGAERQLCNCVVGQHNLGMDVSVLLLSRAEQSSLKPTTTAHQLHFHESVSLIGPLQNIGTQE